MWGMTPSLSSASVSVCICVSIAALLEGFEDSCDGHAGLWMSEESVGDAGANHLGYFTGCFSPDGSSIMAHGYTGALHLWRRPGDMLASCMIIIIMFTLSSS
jgi:hypothetical protein